jgi:HEAT repeat protein
MLELYAPDPQVRKQAEAVLRSVDDRAIPTLTWALRQRDPWLRRPLLAVQSRLPRRLSIALHRVIRPYDAVLMRRAGARGINLVTPPPLAALAALSKALRDDDHQVWSNAAAVLANLGEPGANALIQALRRDDDELRLHALAVMDLRRMNANQAVPVLLDLLARGRGRVPLAAGEVLCTLGPAALPHLFGLLAADDSEARFLTSQALISLGSRDFAALTALIDAAPQQPPRVRREIALALSQMQPFTRRVAWGLARSLSDPDHEVRLAAAAGLRRVLAAADPAIPTLIEALGHSQPETRQLGAAVLADLGPAARAAVPALTQRLGDPDEAVRRQVREALRQITGGLPSAPSSTGAVRRPTDNSASGQPP